MRSQLQESLHSLSLHFKICILLETNSKEKIKCIIETLQGYHFDFLVTTTSNDQFYNTSRL